MGCHICGPGNHFDCLWLGYHRVGEFIFSLEKLFAVQRVIVFVLSSVLVLSTTVNANGDPQTVGQPNFYSYFKVATAKEPGYGHTTNMIGGAH